MSKKLKHITKELDAFVKKTSNMELVDELSFDQLYKFHLLKWSNNSLAEINLNVLNLDKDKHDAYFRMVNSKIDANLQFAIDDNFLDTYLKKYSLKIIDFPFFSNQQINSLLSENISSFVPSNDEAHYKNKFFVKRMQSDFYRYAIFIETNKIFDLVNRLKIISLADSDIFKSNKCKQIFQDLLKFLNIKDTIIRGNQAKIAAIWQADSSRKAIFKASVSKKEYLDYINSIFDSSFTTKSFSDGSYHAIIIDKWISDLNLQ